MSNRRAVAGIASLVLAIIAVAAIYSVTVAQAPMKLTITITDKGIIVSPRDLMGGDYNVTVKNMTSMRRGVELTGMDKGGSTYIRYSKIVAKGKADMFRWYFPSDQTVYVKDVLKCQHAQRGCTIVTFGGMKTAVRFR
jgi:hypothetical protein